jgi:hypothetical protein
MEYQSDREAVRFRHACSRCGSAMDFVPFGSQPAIDSAGFWTYTLICRQCFHIKSGVIDPYDDSLC